MSHLMRAGQKAELRAVEAGDARSRFLDVRVQALGGHQPRKADGKPKKESLASTARLQGVQGCKHRSVGTGFRV